MSDLEKKLDIIEKCIKEGQFGRAGSLIDRIKINEIGRRDSLRASNLSRRCGKVKKSLKILNPIVRNNHIQPAATDEEIADYAFSLHRIGASFEAENLLSKVDTRSTVNALFFRSIIAFSRWEYERALPWLNRYIESPELSDYQKLMGRSNRVGVYLFTQDYEMAMSEVEDLLQRAQEKSLTLLFNLSVEQKAQIYVNQGHYKKAMDLLKGVEQQAQDAGKLLQTWVWKWKTIVEAIQSSPSTGLEILNEATQEALRKQAWEVAREFDFYKYKIFQDQNTLLKLYFGTPFPHYLSKLNEGRGPELPEHYIYHLGNAESTNSQTLDLRKQTLETNGVEISLELTPMQIRLLKSLLVDLYRPLKWGELFNGLFPEEYFDPFSSINRLHQIIFRLNETLRNQSVDLRISSDDAGCRMLSGANLRFKIHKEMEESLYIDPQLLLLKSTEIQNSEFTINDLCLKYGGSKRTQRRWIKKMLEEGKLLKIGNNRSSRYKLSS